ncbi:hypothetical protein KXD93_22450 [Mucilaginibacter sp. BJC16-A38]|uniref:hypothetical protein n=1 Tax=Mucilaginibacter phenanthrenivorans TaxID=1234842 RepID=UPI002157A23F|nr:hypothetical protein [Mucilaginibacter phenanthrenivorans]MCR8560432.1 hypothetical protein [Mucilaginibacter phenanthrenivorans]
MLINELSAGEEILDTFARAGMGEIMQPPEVVSQQINDFKSLCAKAREAWALAVFSGAGRPSLERYFTYHLQLLSDLLGKVNAMPVYTFEACDCSPQETSNEILQKELNDLTGHLLHFFRGYPDKTIPAPLIYIRKQVKTLAADIASIMQSLTLSALPGPLHSVVATYLKEMSSPLLACTFGELLYFEKFIVGMKGRLETVSSFVDGLIDLEFNHVEILSWLHEETMRSMTHMPVETKIAAIKKKAGLLHRCHVGNKEVYDRFLPPLTQMLANWLDEEEKAFKFSNPEQIPVCYPVLEKMGLSLPVAHLACLVRLFVKENLTGATPLTEIFKFVCMAFSTKRAESLSIGGMSKAYYSISQVTAAEVKHLLAKMINRINHDYFPALAAISVLIYAC